MKKIYYLKYRGHPSHYIFLSKLNYIDIPIKMQNIKNPKNLFEILKMRKYLRSFNNDILILEEPRSIYLLDILNGKRIEKNNKTVFIAATPLIYFAIERIYINFFYKVYSSLLFLKSLYKINYFVAVSNLVKEELLKQLGKEYEKRIEIVYPSPEKKIIERNLKIKPDLNSHNILFIGNLIDPYLKIGKNYKGLDILVKAFLIAKKEIKDLKLFIVGNYDKYALEYKKDKDIYFLGYVPDEKMKEIYEKCSLYVHPARFDPFPISTIESMYSGLPVIVSKNTGAKDIVEKVRKDFVLDLDPNKIAERIIEYYNLKENERKELSEEFREKAKEINPERSSQEFKDFIEKIL